ncbi:hypothetical protein SAMN05216324_10599 [Chryseobacterium limigenitum]|uniref:Uncharacterized protein n=1 Tax=Chryseobacterium limigenitum TaxID=1612149 RepID=A0A1K2IM20_9FLAO|nr:hypothetical protein SAMN05216324_10599 [Chryseobacterium limigenitum]
MDRSHLESQITAQKSTKILKQYKPSKSIANKLYELSLYPYFRQ